MSENDVVFTAYDPEQNFTSVMPEGDSMTFGYKHIIHQRPWMVTKMDAVKHTAENTDIAFRDKEHKFRQRFYCLGADKAHPDMYMVVVVRSDDSENTGTIITAFPEDKLPKGVEITYEKRKR